MSLIKGRVVLRSHLVRARNFPSHPRRNDALFPIVIVCYYARNAKRSCPQRILPFRFNTFSHVLPSRTRKYTALHKADTKLDSRCWWLDIKAEITGSVLQCLVGGTISTFVSNLYTLGSLMVRDLVYYIV